MKTITDAPLAPTLAQAAEYLASLGRRLGQELAVTRTGQADRWVIHNLTTGVTARRRRFTAALADATGLPVVNDLPMRGGDSG
jgi:hypothetical protein